MEISALKHLIYLTRQGLKKPLLLPFLVPFYIIFSLGQSAIFLVVNTEYMVLILSKTQYFSPVTTKVTQGSLEGIWIVVMEAK
jgi:hypothetical protein